MPSSPHQRRYPLPEPALPPVPPRPAACHLLLRRYRRFHRPRARSAATAGSPCPRRSTSAGRSAAPPRPPPPAVPPAPAIRRCRRYPPFRLRPSFRRPRRFPRCRRRSFQRRYHRFRRLRRGPLRRCRLFPPLRSSPAAPAAPAAASSAATALSAAACPAAFVAATCRHGGRRQKDSHISFPNFHMFTPSLCRPFNVVGSFFRRPRSCERSATVQYLNGRQPTKLKLVYETYNRVAQTREVSARLGDLN